MGDEDIFWNHSLHTIQGCYNGNDEDNNDDDNDDGDVDDNKGDNDEEISLKKNNFIIFNKWTKNGFSLFHCQTVQPVPLGQEKKN